LGGFCANGVKNKLYGTHLFLERKLS